MALPVEKYIPEAYNLHKKIEVYDACEHGFEERFYSRNDPQSTILDFQVEGNPEHSIVLNQCYLKFTLRIGGKAKRKDSKTGQVVEAAVGQEDDGASVFTVNNIFHSAFESVEVYLGTQPTTKVDKHNPYVGYLHMLKTYSPEALDSFYTLTGWAKDTGGYMDSLVKKGDKYDNTGLNERGEFFHPDEKGLVGEFLGRLCSPIFQQEKILPPQVPMRVILKRADANFFLIGEPGEYTVTLSDVVFVVRKVTVNQSLRESYIKLSEEGNPMLYYLRTPSVNYYSIQKGSTQFMRDDLFMGKMPRLIIIGMVETEAYHGDLGKNPFNFKNYELSEIALYKDGMPYPCGPMSLDFTSRRWGEAYFNTMKSWGVWKRKGSRAPFGLKEFGNGYSLFSFDMSPDQAGSYHPATLLNMNSNIRLEMKFKNPVSENVTLLVYSEMDNLMEISWDRRVTVNF